MICHSFIIYKLSNYILDGANLSKDHCKLVLTLANEINFKTLTFALKCFFTVQYNNKILLLQLHKKAIILNRDMSTVKTKRTDLFTIHFIKRAKFLDTLPVILRSTGLKTNHTKCKY